MNILNLYQSNKIIVNILLALAGFLFIFGIFDFIVISIINTAVLSYLSFITFTILNDEYDDNEDKITAFYKILIKWITYSTLTGFFTTVYYIFPLLSLSIIRILIYTWLIKNDESVIDFYENWINKYFNRNKTYFNTLNTYILNIFENINNITSLIYQKIYNSINIISPSIYQYIDEWKLELFDIIKLINESN
jgi:predicted PurR-regulated permease PerM